MEVDISAVQLCGSSSGRESQAGAEDAREDCAKEWKRAGEAHCGRY